MEKGTKKAVAVQDLAPVSLGELIHAGATCDRDGRA